MKKLISLMLVCVMLCACATALAAGKLEIASQNIYTLMPYSDTVQAYAYAQVENTGDKTIYYSDGLFELYDAEGEVLASEAYLTCCPKVLQPGEKGYLFTSYVRLDDGVAQDAVDDYMLDVTGKGKGDYVVTRYPATVELEIVEDKYSKEMNMYVTIENNSDKTVYDMNIVAAVLDANGAPVFAENTTFYNMGIPAGMKAVAVLDVTSAVIDFFDTNGFVPTSVDCIAYTEEYSY